MGRDGPARRTWAEDTEPRTAPAPAAAARARTAAANTYMKLANCANRSTHSFGMTVSSPPNCLQ